MDAWKAFCFAISHEALLVINIRSTSALVNQSPANPKLEGSVFDQFEGQIVQWDVETPGEEILLLSDLEVIHHAIVRNQGAITRRLLGEVRMIHGTFYAGVFKAAHQEEAI